MKHREGQPDGSQHNVAVVIGRFQVHDLTPAHKELIKHALGHEKTLVFLGSSPLKPTKRNPLTVEARRQMLLAEFPQLQGRISYIDDQPTNEGWSKKLDREIRKRTSPDDRVLLYGSRDSFIPFYFGKYDTCELEQHEQHSATAIRELIASSGAVADPMFRQGMIYGVSDVRYPDPVETCVDIGVWLGEELLLGQKRHEPLLRVVGGFASNKGESFEDDAARELNEETGLTVDPGDLRYLGSFKVDDWRYRSEESKIKTLLFSCEYTGTERYEAADDLWKVIPVGLGGLITDHGLQQIMPSHRPLVERLVHEKLRRVEANHRLDQPVKGGVWNSMRG